MSILAQRNRLKILQLVWDQEIQASDIWTQFDLTFGAISQHLKVMLDAQLVSVRREGRRRWYRARKETLGPLAPALEAMWCEQLGKLKALAETEMKAGAFCNPANHRGDSSSAESEAIANAMETRDPIAQPTQEETEREWD